MLAIYPALRVPPLTPISRRTMEWLHDLVFASDAEIMALWGAGFLVLAIVALLAERMRVRRARIDRVGWVPWTGVFLLCAVIGGGLLALSMPAVLKG